MELTRGNNITTITRWLLVFNTGGWDPLDNEKGTRLSIFDERVILRKGFASISYARASSPLLDSDTTQSAHEPHVHCQKQLLPEVST